MAGHFDTIFFRVYDLSVSRNQPTFTKIKRRVSDLKQENFSLFHFGGIIFDLVGFEIRKIGYLKKNSRPPMLTQLGSKTEI